MSFYAVANGIRAMTNNSSEKLVLVTICSFANDETAEAWPSADYLAEIAMCSPRTVRRCIHALAEDGWIEIIPRDGKSNIFRISEELMARPHGKKVGIPKPEQTPANLSPLTPETQTPDTGISTDLVLTGSDALISKEPINTPIKRFTKPTVEDIQKYMAVHQKMGAHLFGDEAERFHDYHQSRGWKVGKTGMKDWHAAVRTWLRNQEKFANEDSKRVNTRGSKKGPTSSELAADTTF